MDKQTIVIPTYSFHMLPLLYIIFYYVLVEMFLLTFFG